MNKTKKFTTFFILLCGIIIGFMISARLGLTPVATSETSKSAHVPLIETSDLSTAIEQVAQAIGPTVVSIRVESVQHYSSQRRFFGGPFHDEFFDRFFEDFFGETPDFEQKRMGLGSGVIIDPKGFILTNNHVVEGADKITVTLSDGREFKGTLKGTDPRSDLAIVKIDADRLSAARLSESSNLKIGQWVVAIGNPFAHLLANPEPTVTVGVISALNRSLPQTSRRDTNYTNLIQTDAAINPGNSGGPLVNLRGEVVGINVAIFSTSGGYEGVGFAIPVDAAKRIVESLIKGKKVQYGWIGVSIQDLNQELVDYFGLPNSNGAVVSSVLEDGPAEKAGLKSGDVILEVDGVKIKDVSALVNTIGAAPVGETVTLTILRDGRTIKIPVSITARPLFGKEGNAVAETEKQDVQESSWRGVSVQDISTALAKRLRLETEGVIVSDVQAESPGEEAGLRKGDIIFSVEKVPVKNVAEFMAAVKDVRESCLLRTSRGFIVVQKSTE